MGRLKSILRLPIAFISCYLFAFDPLLLIAWKPERKPKFVSVSVQYNFCDYTMFFNPKT